MGRGRDCCSGRGGPAARLSAMRRGSETAGRLVPTPPAAQPTTRGRPQARELWGRDLSQRSDRRDISSREEEEPLRVAWQTLAALPPRLMLCDHEGLPKHQRWFRVLRPNDGDTRPTLIWGKNKDGHDQMSWKTCSSAPPKRRSVVNVSAEEYPPFALGFEIRTDRGPPLKVNAPDSDVKKQWLTAFDALHEALRLCRTDETQSFAVAASRDLDDDSEEDLVGTRPPERAELSTTR